MENWQKDFWEMVQTLSDEVEGFFLGIGEMVDAFVEVTEEVTEELQNTIAIEIDQYFQELTEPFLDMYWELEDVIGDDLDPGFPYPVEPSAEKNPACIGCCHYHGQAYGGNLLVCGMHPYGWDGDNCPDWQSEEF
ncbi:MAG: hypothetical protein KME28_19265 [Pelatocladus maniniholoensis HA4357-MV3]|jgi:hypothetical protein|uniref:Uncharacterized protein n=1 Tax=Pelatocladus maniniholoensis HA4357-MV3 TaxID=1117104 RepID=A0A9E3HAU7_9NOST|nr:hypothetical protein [Pelatocladus maniniholoensis HA4357-MV3]BAZ69704.1 hypothetical protein NIES4106_44820 [Fischerella sp. NIES-4106]